MTRILLRTLVLCFTLTGAAAAQQLATLNVTVSDPAGHVVQGATVTVSNADMEFLRDQTSNRAGLAVLNALAAGNYQVTVKAAGFEPWQAILTLTVGQNASISVQLGIAAVKQSVTVSESSASAIDTDTAESSQVITPQQISDLPIVGRDFIDFALMTPTANVGRSTATAAQSPFQETVLQLSFGGLRETHSSFFGLDGMDYSVSLSGVQHVSPSLDWVQEFRVVDGPFTADNGRNLGS